MQNLNYLFNKAYYRNLGNPKFEIDVKKFNTCIEKTKFDITDYKPSPFKDCQKIVMKIGYPGLIIGMGNPHGVGKDFGGNEEIKTGFSFDYTTGQPYIPASSVKGMLRSYFKEKRTAVSEIIKAVAETEFSAKKPSDDKKSEMELLESDIFDNNDIFLDAVVCCGDKQGYMLSSDYITPHDEKHIKNPVPIKILKINPDVCLEFRFLLNDHTVNGKTVKKEMLTEIFAELLSLFGVGAKTNVGYGIMQPNADKPAYEPEPVPSESLPKKDIPKSKDYPEKVNCQKCGCPNFKFDKKGNLHKHCYKCNAKLN